VVTRRHCRRRASDRLRWNRLRRHLRPLNGRFADVVGKARRRVAAELIADLERVYQRSKDADKELRAMVASTGTT
jgi:hypothetical protein